MNITNDWLQLLQEEFKKPYVKQLSNFINQEYETKTIYPPKNAVFQALNTTPYEKVKVVILGQDPYHGPNQANGLAFSVGHNVKTPPSLVNILQELQSDLGIQPTQQNDLTSWATEGVLLLNTTLTVQAGQPMSHKERGWEQITDKILELVNQKEQPVVFILWGSHAQKKVPLINQNKHLIIKSPHPSPLSAYRGFFGSKPFSITNQFLIHHNLPTINWNL